MDEIDPMSDYKSDYKKDLEDYFCRFTFGQFVTLVLFEIVTLFFVFYLGAKYGSDLMGTQTPVAREESLLPKGKKSVDEIVGESGSAYTYPDVLTGNKGIKIKRSGVTAADMEKDSQNQVAIQLPSSQYEEPKALDQRMPEGKMAEARKIDAKKIEPTEVERELPAALPPEAPATPMLKKSSAKTPGQVTAEDIEKEALKNPPPPPPQQEEAPPVETERTPLPTGKYTIQMGSYPTENEAQAALRQWKKKGYSAFVKEAEIAGKGTWYRVRLGSFPTKDKADAMLQKIKAKEKKTGLVVLNKG